MGKKYKIRYDRENCIGAASCVASAENFLTMDESADGKADIPKEKNPTTKDGWQELIIDEKDLVKNIEAAKSCPVTVIHIIDMETGEEIPL